MPATSKVDGFGHTTVRLPGWPVVEVSGGLDIAQHRDVVDAIVTAMDRLWAKSLTKVDDPKADG